MVVKVEAEQKQSGSIVKRPIRAQHALAKNKGWQYHVARLVGTSSVMAQTADGDSKTFSVVRDMRQPVKLYRRLPNQAPDGTMMQPSDAQQKAMERQERAMQQHRRHERYVKHHEKRMADENAAMAAVAASVSSQLWSSNNNSNIQSELKRHHDGTSREASRPTSAKGSTGASPSGGVTNTATMGEEEDDGLEDMLDQIAPFGGPVASVARQQHALIKRHKHAKPIFETTDTIGWRTRKKEWRNWILEEADPPNFVAPRPVREPEELNPNKRRFGGGHFYREPKPKPKEDPVPAEESIPVHLQKQVWQGRLEGTDKFGYVMFVADVYALVFSREKLPLIWRD